VALEQAHLLVRHLGVIVLTGVGAHQVEQVLNGAAHLLVADLEGTVLQQATSPAGRVEMMWAVLGAISQHACSVAVTMAMLQ
jgi:hypothetical protein